MHTSKTRTRLLMAGAAAILAVGLSGCSAIQGILGGGSNDAPRDDKSGEVTESAKIDIFSLKLGDCLMATGTATQISDANVVPCEQPHDQEVYYEFKLEEGAYDEATVNTAAEQCYGQPFTDFIGVPFDSSSLEAYYLSPTKETWEQLNDRLIQCLIADPAGQTTGTLKASAR
ncbi:hypothetical protein J2Y69_002902 [Microbacterium resistens]|uniref:Septum formation-related domain-containing protein n=1 Tax=Microbacterium resistens TaxID=156977 RepID=A0ABU1SFA4_9MICO|nr:septum formation family protein [Microbacterium resistens]MDR6868288.1 hypothetical protein [Microbacterium resistens]